MNKEKVIPLSIPDISGKEWEYVKECLDTGWVSSAGPFVDRFEKDVADLVGASFAVATSSGTAALHLALLVAGVEPEDEVLVSTLTFAAPANAVRYCGAWPVFVDAEPDYWQMDPELLARFFKEECYTSPRGLINKGTGRRVAAILPVHLLGHPCALDEIRDLADEYALPVVEDAAESLGARYKSTMIGSNTQVACFSFNGNKTITTGGGGMLVTENEAWAARAKYLSTQAKDDPLEYRHDSVGFNYRLSNVLAAIGCAQLERLDEYVEAKRRIALMYRSRLEGLPGVRFMLEADYVESSCWLNTVVLEEDRHQVMERLSAGGIVARPLWTPMHLNPVWRDALILGGNVAKDLQKRSLSLPSSVGLSKEDVDRVVSLLVP